MSLILEYVILSTTVSRFDLNYLDDRFKFDVCTVKISNKINSTFNKKVRSKSIILKRNLSIMKETLVWFPQKLSKLKLNDCRDIFQCEMFFHVQTTVIACTTSKSNEQKKYYFKNYNFIQIYKFKLYYYYLLTHSYSD